MRKDRPRLVVIGNACLDVTYHLDRLPRPGETINARKVVTDLGGKGLNQAIAAARAGAETRFITAIGSDATARKIRAALGAEGMADNGLIAHDGASDDSILLLDTQGENVIVSNTLQAESLSSAEAEAGLKYALDGAALLLLQGNLRQETTYNAMNLAREAGIAIAFNPSPLQHWFGDLPEADIVIANQVEAEALNGRTGTHLTVITLGAKGCRLERPGQADVTIPAPKVAAIAAGGAGDVFAGTFIAEWLATGDAERAARLGVRAASDKATRHGTLSAFPTPTALADFRRELLSLSACERPIMTDASPLLSSAAVRTAAQRMLADGLSDRLEHWSVDLEQLPKTARFVAQLTRENYPSLTVPFHSRWRHFEAGGIDRWGKVLAERTWPSKEAQARAALDLAIVSVLLDAGSGGRWSYTEASSGKCFASSEGLGVASFDLIASGVLSSDPSDPWRADAERLIQFKKADLEKAFQVSADNPLAGVDGRVALLNRLGEACRAQASHFAISDAPRPGGIADSLASQALAERIEAAQILRALLDTLGTIWPSRLTIGETPLGDTWCYERWQTADEPLSGLVPLHKLSQWLTYSLIEPLIVRGLDVAAIDGLTGLAEYRNGGLFIDMEVLRLKDKTQAARPHEVNSPLIVEWRALTVALLDRLLTPVRDELGISADRFPIASMLEGGTWAAGRRIARAKRADGSPPLNIVSDGTTF